MFNKFVLGKRDLIHITKYVFVGFYIFTIFQKVINPYLFENFSEFITLILEILFNKEFHIMKYLFYIIIVFELLIIIRINFKFFMYTVLISLFLLGLGLIFSSNSIYYGLNKNCGCGIFGDNPYLIFFKNYFYFLCYFFK